MSNRDKITVIIVLGLVILAWTINSILHPRIKSGDLNLVGVMISKDIDPTLYPRDDIFADDTFYRFYTPFYRWLVKQSWYISGSFEWSLIYLTPFALAIYLAGMFILLRRVSHNSWLALGITIASANYYGAMGNEIWGVGGSNWLMSRTIFTAIVPYLVLILFSFLEKPGYFKAAGLGLALGLAANLHPVSGLQLGIMIVGLIGLIYGLRKDAWRYWLMLCLLGLSMGLGAWPITGNVTRNTELVSVTPVKADFALVSQIIHERYELPFRPSKINWELVNLELSRPVLDYLVWVYVGLMLVGLTIYIWGRWQWPWLQRWGWLFGGLLVIWYAYMIALFNLTFFFILVASYVIYRFWSRSVQWLDWLLVSWLGLIVLVSFVGFYLLVLVWETFEIKVPFIVFTAQSRAARFVYLPLYLLVGLAAQTWLKVGLDRLEKLWLCFKLRGWPPRETSLSLVFGVILCLGPGLSEDSFMSFPFLWLVIFGLGGAILFIPLLLESSPIQSLKNWRVGLGTLVLILILFGPLAPLFRPLLPIPVLNSLKPEARIPQPISLQAEAELYDWVRQHTEQDALFFWCDLHRDQMLQFRRLTQRSTTLNWKDMNLASKNITSLLYSYNRYRELETACRETSSTLAMAHSLKANFILAPARRAVGWEAESCFLNDQYVLFSLDGSGCLQLQSEAGVQQKQ